MERRARIALLEHRELEERKRQPGGTNDGALPNGEIEALDRQRVRRRAEAEIDVDAAGDRCAFHVVLHPASVCIALDVDLEVAIPDPPVQTRVAGSPQFVGAYAIVD